MKMGRTATLVAITAVGVASAVQGFGPAECVSVSRSGTGSCVVKTSCGGQDLSNFDITFDCVAQSGRQTHSMGVGSFDNEEEYDTDLKCQQCLPSASKPSDKKALAKRPAVAAKGVSLAAVSVSREVQLRGKPASEEAEDAPKAEWYGPEECVGVWRDDKSGSCVMQTDCDADTQLNVYEFGMVCVDKDDEMTRHIFGMGSFGHKETFNTLIKCEQCLALDEYMDGGKAIGQLTKMVKGMKGDLQGVSAAVGKLNNEVFPQAGGPAGAPSGAAPAAASAPAAAQPAQFLAAPVQQQAPPPPASTQPPAAPAPKQEIQDVAPQAAVTHVKKKASIEKEQSMQEILSAAVKGAADRGAMVMGTAKAIMTNAAAQDKAAPMAVAQTQQQVTQDVAKQAPAEQKVEVVEEEESEEDEDEEDNHSKAEQDED